MTVHSIGAVVLNYNDYNSTILCVESLRACVPGPERIVIVDNDSPNESLRILTNRFGNTPGVAIINSGKNGGYSFGNNVGIRELRKNNIRHVVIATPDTEVVSRNLFNRLSDCVSDRIGAMGPQIIGPNGLQNPSVRKLSLKYLLDMAWLQWGMPGLRLRRALVQLKRRVAGLLPRQKSAQAARTHSMPVPTESSVFKLHGAFLCLTDSFFRKVGELDERIFMFGEEDLIAWQCLENELEELLIEDVFVKHADDSSINQTWGSNAQRFIDEQQKCSCLILKAVIRKARLWQEWQRQ